MTNREDVPALIAEANKALAENQWTSGWGVESLADRLADALEAERERAEEAERAAEDHVLDAEATYERMDLRVRKAEQRATELAAVVEEVRDYLDEDKGAYAPDLYAILASAPTDALREVKASAIREYVEAARENPHTQYWPASGVLDDAEQWADEIEKGGV